MESGTWNLDMAPRELLTRSNPKTQKGIKQGYSTAILHFAPGNLSGREMCSHRTKGCFLGCINTAGHGGIGLDADGLNSVQIARIRRTRWFSNHRDAFMAQLYSETYGHVVRSEANGLKPAERPNGLSDIPWENVRCGEYANIFEAFPQVAFYDYTKFPLGLRKKAVATPNYHLTYSLAETAASERYAREALSLGVNVAVVFAVKRGQPLPDEFWSYPVVDGDASDLRFLDPAPCVVGLRAKGRAIGDTSGFVKSPA